MFGDLNLDLRSLFTFSHSSLPSIMLPNRRNSVDVLSGLNAVHSFDLESIEASGIIDAIYNKSHE